YHVRRHFASGDEVEYNISHIIGKPATIEEALWIRGIVLQDIGDKHLRNRLRSARAMPKGHKLRHNLIHKHRFLLSRFGTVEAVFIRWRIEENIHQWQAQTCNLILQAVMKPHYTGPETNL